MPKRLKAYEVREGYEGHCVICFATNNATARREGAGELDIDWEDVETCRRRPQFDVYAPGPVPPLVLIEHGWWFECMHCGRHVSEDMPEQVADEGLDPADFEPVEAGRHVFCSRTCEATHHAEHRANAAAKVALIELFNAKFPDCTIKDVHVYGQKLETSGQNEGHKCSVQFMFPGAKYGATFVYGDEFLFVANGDLEAYHAWSGTQRDAAPA